MTGPPASCPQSPYAPGRRLSAANRPVPARRARANGTGGRAGWRSRASRSPRPGDAIEVAGHARGFTRRRPGRARPSPAAVGRRGRPAVRIGGSGAVRRRVPRDQREPYHEPGAAVPGLVHGHRAAVRDGDVPHYGQPQAGAAAVAAAGGVEPGEPFEDPLALVLGNAGAVIAHADHDVRALGADLDLDEPLRVALSVDDQVDVRPGDLVARRLERGQAVEAQPYRDRALAGGGLRADELAQVDELHLPRIGGADPG